MTVLRTVDSKGNKQAFVVEGAGDFPHLTLCDLTFVEASLCEETDEEYKPDEVIYTSCKKKVKLIRFNKQGERIN